MSSKLREALEATESVLSTWIDHLPPVVQDEAQEALYKAEAAFAEPLTQAEICESMLKSFTECDTSITGWSVTYPPGGTIAKVEIPRAVYEMLLAAFHKVCRVKLALRKDEGEN
jgi:hypothetical protein